MPHEALRLTNCVCVDPPKAEEKRFQYNCRAIQRKQKTKQKTSNGNKKKVKMTSGTVCGDFYFKKRLKSEKGGNEECSPSFMPNVKTRNLHVNFQSLPPTNLHCFPPYAFCFVLSFSLLFICCCSCLCCCC